MVKRAGCKSRAALKVERGELIMRDTWGLSRQGRLYRQVVRDFYEGFAGYSRVAYKVEIDDESPCYLRHAHEGIIMHPRERTQVES